MSGPGLPMITGTRIDSAAKHQIASRIDYEKMLSWVSCDQNRLLREKLRFSMNENDLAIHTGPPLRNNEPCKTNHRNKAYPSVVVTLADMQPSAINYLIALYHNCTSSAEADRFVEEVERTIEWWVGHNEERGMAMKQIQEMPKFSMCGISVGTAWAHPNSGDNVATVLIGGLRTIMNGAFPIQCNDLVMWYWDEEWHCFQSDGRRIPQLITSQNGTNLCSEDVTRFINANIRVQADDERRRKGFFDQGNGNFSAPSRDGNVKGKRRIAYPKPFRYDDNNERIFDRMRVFAKALCSARPFEPVDIMVGCQSL